MVALEGGLFLMSELPLYGGPYIAAKLVSYGVSYGSFFIIIYIYIYIYVLQIIFNYSKLYI